MNIDQKKWFCMQCSLQFESSSVFDLHLKLLHKKVIEEETIETKPNLEECFNNDVELLAKSNKKDFVHERKKSSKCQFNKQNIFKKRTTHTDEKNIYYKKWSCVQCSFQFESRSVFELHSFLHSKEIKKETIQIKQNSEESFNNEAERVAKSHKKTFFHERKKNYECNLCQYSSPRRDVMNLHILSIHEGKKPYKCDLCTYACTRKCRLNEHFVTVHEGKKPFKCESCQKCFSRKQG